MGAKMKLCGIGIDLEGRRQIRKEAARFFLSEKELEWLRRQNEPSHLLRLWTVKEALYKANPKNEDTGLADYVLEHPGWSSGKAYLLRMPALEFHYNCIPFRNGFLSVAFVIDAECLCAETLCAEAL